MKNLLLKELKLSAHPTLFIFMTFPCMLLIPNYPYTVTYFYITLSVFFTCMMGRENHDIQYTMMLPISKSDVVKGRFLFTLLAELTSLVISIPFIIIRQTVYTTPNLGGMDANLSLIGLAMLVYAVFNVIFFIKYYKDVKKPGVSFVFASVAEFLLIIVLEVLDHATPFFIDELDTADSKYILVKIIFVVICAAVYAVSAMLTCKKCVKSFEALDL